MVSALAATALRGADVLGADTVAGAQLAMAGRFLELLGNDVIQSAERHWRAIVGRGTQEHAS